MFSCWRALRLGCCVCWSPWPLPAVCRGQVLPIRVSAASLHARWLLFAAPSVGRHVELFRALCLAAYFWNIFRLPPQVMFGLSCARLAQVVVIACVWFVLSSAATMTPIRSQRCCACFWRYSSALCLTCYTFSNAQLCPKLDYKGSDGADDPAVRRVCILFLRVSILRLCRLCASAFAYQLYDDVAVAAPA